MQSVLILGRQPELGLAEVESLYGAAAVRPVGDQAVVVDIDPCLLAFDRLGGAVKFCKLLTILATVKWPAIETFLRQVAPGHASMKGAYRQFIRLPGLLPSTGKDRK